jgi:hypothetical protein
MTEPSERVGAVFVEQRLGRWGRMTLSLNEDAGVSYKQGKRWLSIGVMLVERLLEKHLARKGK